LDPLLCGLGLEQVHCIIDELGGNEEFSSRASELEKRDERSILRERLKE